MKKYSISETSQKHSDIKIVDIKTLLLSDTSAPFVAHTHENYQIIWFKKGQGVHYVDYNKYPIRDNTLFFLSSGQIHHFDRDAAAEGVVIHFSEELLSAECCMENTTLKFNLFNAFDTVPHFTIDDPERLHLIESELRHEIEQGEAFAHLSALNYLIKMFLIYVQRTGIRGEGVPLCMNNPMNRTFVLFRELLENNFRTKHTVKDYAILLHITTKTLTNYVQRITKSTPLSLINNRILLEAKRQLNHTDLKVKEIAYSLGFEEPSYFIKFFKRLTGVTPADFREL